MREILILALIAAAGYLAYDDFYVQRPALKRAQAGILPVRNSRGVYSGGQVSPVSPGWFQKHLNESSARLDAPSPKNENAGASAPP